MVKRVVKRYSPEVKQRARELLAKGYTHRQTAQELGIPQSTIATWLATSKAKDVTSPTTNTQDIMYTHPSHDAKALLGEITAIRDNLLDTAAKLDEHLQYLHHWDAVEQALVEATNLRLRLERALVAKKELEDKLISRAMAVHSQD